MSGEIIVVGNENIGGLPQLFATDQRTAEKVLEFFTVNIRNANTRRAYAKAAGYFATWCLNKGIATLPAVRPVDVAAYIEDIQREMAAPSVKLHLAAIKMLFDWLVVGQVVPANPAGSVRGPKYSVKKGKTPILTLEEAQDIFKVFDDVSIVGLRDRVLVGLMVYSFARVGAAIKMLVEDVYIQGRRTWVRLHEKGGKLHEMPCHHKLEEYLHAYIEAAGIGADKKGFLFRTACRRTEKLTENPMTQADVYRMINRRAIDTGIQTKIGCHSFRATGITEYLKNGGKLEIAQQMANHESARTTGLYDRRDDQISLDEVERIII